MSLGRRISPDPVGGNFGNFFGFDQLYDHGIDPAAAVLNVGPGILVSLAGQELSDELPPELSAGKSIRFRGDPDKWDISVEADLGPTDFTIAVFFRKIDAECDADATLISKGQVGSGEWALWLDQVGSGSDTIGFSAGGAAFDVESATGIVNDELWHHVTVTRVGTLVSLYVDGSLEDTATNSVDLTNPELLRFAVKNTSSDFFGGRLTGMKRFDAGLNATQVALLASGSGGPTPDEHIRFLAAEILSAPASNHGTLNGGAFFDASTLAGQLQGKTGADEILAVSHDGVDDTVTFPAVTFIGEFTAALFFKPDDLTLQTLIGDVVIDRIQIGSSTTILVVVGAGTLTFTVPAMDTNWHTIVVARDASNNIRVFLDDVESTTGALVDAADTTFAKIGAHGAAATDPFDGHTAKVVLEPGEWTATERTAYFTDGSTTSAFTDFRSNTGLIEVAEPGAPAGTVSTQFDGVDDHIQDDVSVPTVQPGLPFGVGITAFIPIDTAFQFLFFTGQKGSASTSRSVLINASGLAVCQTRLSSTIEAVGTTDVRGKWVKFIGSWESASLIRIWVDAVNEGTNTSTLSPNNFDRFTIGRAGDVTPDNPFRGLIRNIQVWNRLITQQDADDYQAGISTGNVANNWPLATEGNLVADNIGDFADTAQDSSVAVNHGTLLNYAPDPNLGWVESVPPQLVGQETFSLDFIPASSQRVTFTSEITQTGTFTAVGWINLRDVTTARVMIGAGADGNTGLQFGTNGRFLLRINGGNLAASVTVVNLNEWAHIACTRDGSGNVLYYLNGVDDTSGAPNSSATATWGSLGSRGAAGSAFFDGLLKDWRVYSSALSPADISTLSGGGTIAPVALNQWRLNDARIFETMQAWATDSHADTTRFTSADFAEGIPFNDSDYVENVIVPSTNTTGIIGASCIPPVSERFVDGIPGTGVRLRQTGASTASFDIQSPVPFELAFVEIDGNALAGGNLITLTNAAHNVHNNILHDLINTTGAAGGIDLKTAATGSTIHNNFIYRLLTTTGACFGIQAAIVCDIFANSILSMLASTDADGAGINLTALAVLINNIAADCDFDNVGTAGTGSTKNLTSDGTALGTSPITGEAGSALFVAVAPGSENLHLLSTAAAIDQGLNLDSTGVIGIARDIDDERRPTLWDIGADEFFVPPPTPSPGVGGGGATIISRTRRRRRLLISPFR